MNGLDTEYEQSLTCEVLDATTPDNKAKIQELGFKTHGMVFYDDEGTLLKKMDGHLMQEPKIRQAVKEVLGGV